MHFLVADYNMAHSQNAFGMLLPNIAAIPPGQKVEINPLNTATFTKYGSVLGDLKKPLDLRKHFFTVDSDREEITYGDRIESRAMTESIASCRSRRVRQVVAQTRPIFGGG